MQASSKSKQGWVNEMMDHKQNKRQDNKRDGISNKGKNSGVWATQQQLQVMLNLWIES